jgi:Rhs element Vgr protein
MTGGGVVRIAIYADGTALPETTKIMSVDVVKRVNRLPAATVVFDDGDMPAGDFPLSSSKKLDPGVAIKIAAGYGDDEDTIFEGVVVQHGVSISSSQRSRLVVECRDKAVKMTIGRKNAQFSELTDSDIIAKLISGAGGLTQDVDATTVTYGDLVQYYCTDWDFMVTRAEANGLLVIAEAGKISVKAPDVSSPAALKVTYGVDLIDFHADIDARSQIATVSGVSWDPVAQAIVESQASPKTLNEQGDLTSATLAAAFGSNKALLQTSAPLDQATLKAWTEAQQVKAGLARIRGRMRFQGSALAQVGTLVALEGIGVHFNGSVFAGSVHHELADGDWTTEVEFGLPPDWFVETPNVVSPPASGWTPGVEGLQVGVVKKLDANPKGEPMVQVELPVLKADGGGVWARIARLYASEGVGAFFIPEVGDEVVLGFLANDPSFPVVLGSLHSSKRKPPYDLTADNFTKGFVTKSKLKLGFDDEKKVVTIETPGGNKMVLSDDGKSVALTDQNGNSVKLDSGGITLESAKDVTIKAQGAVNVTSTTKMSLSSQADLALAGMNVNAEAQVGFVGKGAATAELSASGQVTVKGAIVMIN